MQVKSGRGIWQSSTWVASLLAFAFVAAACGGSSSTEVEPATVTAAQACSDQAHARCTHLQVCSQLVLTESYASETECETRTSAQCTAALASPATGATPNTTETLAQGEPGWDCVDFLVDANPPPDCVQVTGPGANGSPCQAFAQCQSGFCAFASSTCGTCAVAPVANQPCTPTHQCAPGLECLTSTSTCVVPVGAGGACGTGIVCAPGDRCVKGTCQTATVNAPAGHACGSVNGTVTGCAQGSCVEVTTGTLPECIGRAADGAACNLSMGPFCESPALCIAGTCQHPSCQ